jgi:poly(3-hydroxybutyrate) depolymerase
MSAAVALLLLLGASAQDPAAALAEAVDLPTPTARARAAAALVKRNDVTLEQWLAAARTFAPAAGGPDGAGPHSVSVELPVLDGVEPTTIHLYLPASRDPARPAPLLLALHGAGGDGAQMLGEWRAAADALGMIVCAPTDPQADGGYAFTPRERAAALAALRWTRRHYDVDENRVHLAGSSRGGHLAWDLALRHPDLWASASPRIGGPTFVVTGGRNNLRYAENLARLPLRDLQGAADDPKLLLNLRLAFARLHAAGATDAELLVQEGHGHSYHHDAVDWVAFLGGAVRDPFPESVRLRAAWEAPARAAWIEIARYGKEVKEVFPIEVDERWDGWEHERRVQHYLELADARTADLRVERAADAVFRIEATGVAIVRLRLPDGFDAPGGRITVLADGKERKVAVRRSAATLLADFVERYDRSFLPSAEAEIRL